MARWPDVPISRFQEFQDHVFVVEITLADLQAAGLHSVGFEAERTIKGPRSLLPTHHGQGHLLHPWAGFDSLQQRYQQRSPNSLPPATRAHIDAPNPSLVPSLGDLI